MDTTNIRHQFDLSRQKIIIVLFFLLSLSITAFAQKGQESGNLPDYDDKWMHYGFTVGLNSTKFKIQQSDFFVQDTSVTSVIGLNKGGFNLGFVLNLRLAEHFDLRLLPSVAFYERAVEFRFKSAEPEEQVLEQTFIELPLVVKFKSTRRKNMRMYVLAGLKPGIEVGAKKNERKSTQLRTKANDLAIELGVGFDIYYELFKWSPELRLSFGLPNLLFKDPNVYSNSVDRLSTFTVSIFSHFE